ncbi:NAD kinase [Aurantibacillus circumpalustris]|uniref:NAD kinase n=1 Tax=Aurantibacillus circumpalustris TaxID=3036359 RepID=UPI00295B49BE|nr:NAD kinase [Aurantibacillus circumpalustris]
MTIAIYARSTKDNHAAYIEQMHNYLKAEGVDMIVYEPYYAYLKNTSEFDLELDTFYNSEELIAKAYYLICLGGDGTMLETVTFVRKSGIPILGVNTGRLGFLSQVNKDDLQKALQLLLREKFTLDKRELIEIGGCNNCFNDENYALNEFTIHKKDSSSMINIDTYVDGIFLNTYFADGLIVSTPTGSTAYSLSCGGPIMMPDSDNFIITPIAPHNLTVRPIVIPNNREIRFSVTGRYHDFNVSLDSRGAQIPTGSEIRIKKADFRLNLINLEGQNFFTTLRNKMMWGIDRRQ